MHLNKTSVHLLSEQTMILVTGHAQKTSKEKNISLTTSSPIEELRIREMCCRIRTFRNMMKPVEHTTKTEADARACADAEVGDTDDYDMLRA
jgi:hypothetical protein